MEEGRIVKGRKGLKGKYLTASSLFTIIIIKLDRRTERECGGGASSGGSPHAMPSTQRAEM
jgi:hypothetical protein